MGSLALVGGGRVRQKLRYVMYFKPLIKGFPLCWRILKAVGNESFRYEMGLAGKLLVKVKNSKRQFLNTW
jgi:hypothetical protein